MSEKLIVFDTTLRDGEQAAGLRLNAYEKREIAEQLVELNVDIIEAGYPNSSEEDFKAVKLISEKIKDKTVVGLSRAVPADIEACIKAFQNAHHPRIQTGIGVSEYHIRGKFQADKYGTTYEEKKETIYKMAVDAVKLAKSGVEDVQFYAEDAGRADQDFLFRILEGAIDAGATVVNIPDTTGYATPEQFGSMIKAIKNNVPNIDKALISVHCHNDLGMAVANTLACVKNGARQIECTINGIGERAGNAALEELVLNLKVRNDYYKYDTNVNIKELYITSQLVSRKLGIPVPMNKAIVGTNAFSHSSGIHVDGFLKSKDTYEILKPEEIGFPSAKVILTARSGRHALKYRFEQLGYDLKEDELENLYSEFLSVADKVKEVTNEMLIAIIQDKDRSMKEYYKLEYLHVNCGINVIPSATVKLKINDRDTELAAACGNGPVDAAFKAIKKIIGSTYKLQDFNINSVSNTTEALGEVTLKIKLENKIVLGHGTSTDIIEASVKAFINGINKFYIT